MSKSAIEISSGVLKKTDKLDSVDVDDDLRKYSL
jgi:hypothetical protein